MPRIAWINPAHLKRCDGKRGFRSLATAETEAERASAKTGELIIAYTCFDCGQVHIGHADLSQQLARIPHIDRPCRQCGGIIPESKKQKARRLQAIALAQLFTNDREGLSAALGHDVSHLSAHAPEIRPEQAVAPEQEIAHEIDLPKQGFGMGRGL